MLFLPGIFRRSGRWGGEVLSLVDPVAGDRAAFQM